MFLGAGPGKSYSSKHFYKYYHGKRAQSWYWELSFVNQKRDLILINQRDNPDAPGLPLDSFELKYKNRENVPPFDWNKRNKNRS